MKKCNFAKISVLILALSVCFGTVFAMSANADNTGTKPEIISQNVKYTDQFCLMYAVDSSAVAPVTLNVYRAVPNEETPCDNSYTVGSLTPGADSGLGKDAYIFTVQGVGATKLDTEFYVQAVDSKGNKSDLKRYSVVEYLYERLASDRITEAQKQFYNDILIFGAKAQVLFAEDETGLITDMSYVTVNGGTVNDFINDAGVYQIGDTITLRAPNAITATWSVTTTAEDGTESISTVTDKYVVTDAVKTEFELVSSKNYRPEVSTFEDKTDGETDTKFTSGGLNGTKSYVYEEGRGMVFKVSMKGGGVYATDVNTSIASKDEATAFELSYDIKIDFHSYDVTQRQMVLPCIRFDGSSRITRISLGHNKNQSYLSFINPSTGKDTFALKNIDFSDWFHVRMVYYKGDTNGYVYINGSDTPYILDYADGAGSSGYTGDITKIGRIDFLIEQGTFASDVYIDNLFYGFTTDTLSAAE